MFQCGLDLGVELPEYGVNEAETCRRERDRTDFVYIIKDEYVGVKVQQSPYRTGQTLRVLGG